MENLALFNIVSNYRIRYVCKPVAIMGATKISSKIRCGKCDYNIGNHCIRYKGVFK